MRILIRILKVLAALGLVAAIVLATGAVWFRRQVQLSLAYVDGHYAVPALQAPVTVERDARGVPTIQAESRPDAAAALGYLHAQERFFQMDLARRSASGELAELIGRGAVSLDRRARIHRFRALAVDVLKALPPAQRELVEAYTAGVNVGLSQLRKKPFEYIVLRTEPAKWQAEDCVLCVYAMALKLQDSTGSYDYALGALRRQLGAAAASFMAPVGSTWDASLDGSTVPAPLLALPETKAASPVVLRSAPPVAESLAWATRPTDDFLHIGSNSFAVGPSHSASGAAILAGDMHLGLQVPNVWYRARLKWAAAGAEAKTHDVVGITIPGIPVVLSGSNGSVAWNFTNAHVDTTDLVVVDYISRSEGKYRIGDGQSETLQTYNEVIKVKGGAPVVEKIQWSRWGPLTDSYDRETSLAVCWTLHDASAVNFDLAELETAPNLDRALAIAKRAGVPALNILLADRAGGIGWTICGKIPNRVGTDGRFPTSWASEGCRWDGYLDVAQYPEVRDPASGRLWTANNRIVGGNALARLGDGRYDLGARAKQIEADLAGLEQAKPSDLLAIQLDDRSAYMEQWRGVILASLKNAGAVTPARKEFLDAIESWNGHASTDSVGYYLLRSWVERFKRVVFGSMVASCRHAYPQLSPAVIRFEDPLWTLVQKRPSGYLDTKFKSWDDAILQAVDDVAAEANRRKGGLRENTWGRFNRVAVDHPLGAFLPSFLRSWLAMPTPALPGDHDLPRVQSGAFGASERLVVSPGRESEALFEMPGGQSGNPLSPFFRGDHAAWVKGEATPLLPGPTAYRLTLTPHVTR